MSNRTAKCRIEQPNVEWNSQMSNGTAKCRMEQPNVEWNSQISNGTAKCQMEQPNVEWNSQMSNGTAKCRMEHVNVEWNSQESNGMSCSHGDDHDVNPETDLARNRARALQPFYSLFLQSRSTLLHVAFPCRFFCSLIEILSEQRRKSKLCRTCF